MELCGSAQHALQLFQDRSTQALGKINTREKKQGGDQDMILRSVQMQNIPFEDDQINALLEPHAP
jgi:hypothetical protein